MMKPNIPISVGEFFDKLTILQIKSERIQSTDKLANVFKELKILKDSWNTPRDLLLDIRRELEELKLVNTKLWDIEDQIRQKEAEKKFDSQFIELARSVYLMNDKRSAIKQRLNLITKSEIIEEKSYTTYESSV